jgi:hypothetical protein
MSANFWFSNLWLAGAPPVPWEPPTKTNGGEATSGKERDGVLVLGDATKLSHSMR